MWPPFLGTCGFDFESRPIKFYRLLTDIILGGAISHDAELSVPIDNPLVAKRPRLHRIGGAKTLRNLGHRLAPTGHELGATTDICGDVVDEEPRRAAAAAHLHVAVIESHFGAPW